MGAFKMYQLLQATGKKYLECDVRIDILKAPEIQVPEYANATPDFVNTYSRKLADADPIPITAENILEWVNTVSPAHDDVVFVYFTGHGGTYPSGDNVGEFHLSLPSGAFNRGRLVEAMDRLGCRLKILLTDTGSYSVSLLKFGPHPVNFATFYKHLFFQHEGFLNVVSAEARRIRSINSTTWWFVYSSIC